MHDIHLIAISKSRRVLEGGVSDPRPSPAERMNSAATTTRSPPARTAGSQRIAIDRARPGGRPSPLAGPRHHPRRHWTKRAGAWPRSRYFWYHHTAADTPDKLDPRDVARSVAALAVMAWIAAEMPERIPFGRGAPAN